MALRFYNTLTLQLQPFAPQSDNTVRMYTCGPTVYNFSHIGNFRSFVFYDLLRRWLRASGYKLDHVMNITDVDDKIIRNAVAEGKSLAEYSGIYTKAFFEDAKMLRLEIPEHVARATDHIGEMADAIATLGEKGYTYNTDGSVYYRISQFPEYGKLSHNDFSGMKAGARVDVDEYEKADARDFVLWKAPKDGEPFWETKVGRGRPGWHIECSVMAIQYLGDTLDLHAGGIDLIFPHHENEIAQSEALTGKPFARFWMHAEFLLVEGQKMSKSLGNFYTLRDILGRGHPPETVRYLLASVPYRKSLNFKFSELQAAASAIDRVRSYKLRLETTRFAHGLNEQLAKRASEAMQAFRDAMDDDLNTAQALAAVFEYINDTNSAMDSGAFLAGNVPSAAALLQLFDSVFDVLEVTRSADDLTDEQVEAKIAERIQARKSKDYKLSDAIRDELAAKGIILEDTKDGIRWKRK
jgi:cysteinyl-tRNA synthetase